MKRTYFAASILAIFTLTLFYAFPTQAKAQATTPSNKNVEQVLIQMEHDWITATVKGDLATIERIVADDWLETNAEGTVSKAQHLAGIKSGAHKLESANLEGLRVRVFGDTAIVTGIQIEKSQLKGKDSSGRYFFTDVFLKRNNRWQVVATQWARLETPKP